MNDVKIELVINIDGVCSKTMPYDKAQQLYNELAKIFYRPQINHRHPTDIQLADGKTIRASSTNIQESRQQHQPENQLRDQIASRIKNTGSDSEYNQNEKVEIKQNPMYDRMADANTRIEAARERAAARTSKCGSSRSC